MFLQLLLNTCFNTPNADLSQGFLWSENYYFITTLLLQRFPYSHIFQVFKTEVPIRTILTLS